MPRCPHCSHDAPAGSRFCPRCAHALPDATRREVAQEIADVQIYLVRLADKLGIDILEAAAAKIEDNERRYPAGGVRGSATKFSRRDRSDPAG